MITCIAMLQAEIAAFTNWTANYLTLYQYMLHNGHGIVGPTCLETIPPAVQMEQLTGELSTFSAGSDCDFPDISDDTPLSIDWAAKGFVTPVTFQARNWDLTFCSSALMPSPIVPGKSEGESICLTTGRGIQRLPCQGVSPHPGKHAALSWVLTLVQMSAVWRDLLCPCSPELVRVLCVATRAAGRKWEAQADEHINPLRAANPRLPVHQGGPVQWGPSTGSPEVSFLITSKTQLLQTRTC